MNNITLNRESLARWFRDNGDYTHNINYNLNENSCIIDLGGYTGVWAQQMIEKYNPNVYILEPVTKFYDGMVSKFSDNNKVHLMNIGISTKNENGVIYLSNDGTSSNLTDGESITVKFNTVETILENWGLDEVDLLQMNIEGDEYPVLEHMLKTGNINKFKNIQIQFHLGIDNAIERRDKILGGLKSNGFKLKFNYPFVWESWTKNI
jgi:FkbM family methyltransferase